MLVVKKPKRTLEGLSGKEKVGTECKQNLSRNLAMK